jgi:hypothetical protein
VAGDDYRALVAMATYQRLVDAPKAPRQQAQEREQLEQLEKDYAELKTKYGVLQDEISRHNEAAWKRAVPDEDEDLKGHTVDAHVQ